MASIIDDLGFTPAATPRSLMDREKHAYFRFNPRPDQVEKDDQQHSFVNNRTKGVSFLLGGNGAGTTECAMAKLSRFLINDQPPPRRDTPFWVISDTLETCIKNTWKEKLSPDSGHGHIPPSEIDWDRISWFREKEGLPLVVPLKEWPGRPGKNWCLEFKSYDQGRSRMQGQSIGGFCFVEQFPWDMLTEVLRGCREYSFAGSMFCEFTPINPDLSYELEMMISNDTLPKGWEVYYANTECALEFGHVSQEWFDSFFSMIPESMRETRTRGKFASYEGAVYPQFSPKIHLVDDDVIDFPEGVFHRRAIDWGSGPENAFCCLWAYKNGHGQWFVYDEYYSTAPVTTIEHLSEISRRSKMWGWKSDHPEYGATYADPSSPGDIRIANSFSMYCPKNSKGEPLYEQISVTSAANNVRQGIEHVQWLLQPAKELARPMVEGVSNDVVEAIAGLAGVKQEPILVGSPRLFIHGKRCPHLARQMRTYRYHQASEAGLNPQNPKREPVKKDDHACTIATMPVLTKRGWIPIISVTSDDFVYSGSEWSRVLVGATETGKQKPLVRVVFEDGPDLICTPDHELLTESGWMPASRSVGHLSLTSIPMCQEQELQSRELGIVEFAGRGSRTRGISQRDISERLLEPNELTSCCIDKSMRIFTERYLLDSTLIMSTRTARTTPRKIFEPCHHQCTRPGTHQQSFRQCNQLLRKSERLTPQSLDALFKTLGLRQKNTGRIRELSLSPVSSAAKPTLRQTQENTNRDYVLRNANQLPDSCLPSSALFATSNFDQQRERLRRSIAHGNVRRIIDLQPAGSDNVYCLASESGSMVWQGGAVVSNCDALRYLVFTESNRSGFTPDSVTRRHDASRHGVHAIGQSRKAVGYGTV